MDGDGAHWARKLGHMIREEIRKRPQVLAAIGLAVLFAGVGLPVDAIRAQIAAAIDVIVQVMRVPGGGRQVREVAEVGLGVAPNGAPSVLVLATAGGVAAAPSRPARSVRC